MFVPVIIAASAVVALLIVRASAFRVLHRWGSRGENRPDDLIITVFRTPSIYWCLAVGLYLGIAVSDIPDKYVFYISKSINVIVILSITIATANLGSRTFREYIRRSSLSMPATGLAYGIIYGSVLIIGLLIILSFLGISIAPLITALGIGGLAVALALQDTMSNLFAGIHILVERSIRVGDVIRLESGLEGSVEDITWRTTRIKMNSNNMIVIPNNKLSQSIVTNYNLPEKRLAAQVQIVVGYEADADTIEKILKEEASGASSELPYLLTDPAPSVFLDPGFGESGLNFTVVCQVAGYGDLRTAQHEIRKRIIRRFRQEGITMPYVQKAVYIQQGRA
ncbi:MAG: mechanosensitive ion channel family protein [Nitrospirae bacterium]|nr:mechanosensitive ion channel family protein [Nitrospirota bacterium]